MSRAPSPLGWTLASAIAATLGCSVAVESGPVEPPATRFVDLTVESGISHVYRYPPDTPVPVQNFGGGAVAEDLDGDLAIDLYVANGFGAKALFWNNGDGTFTEGAAQSGAAAVDDWTAGVAAADLDNDGDQDLLLINEGADRVLLNDGQRRFHSPSAATGLETPTAGHGASFGDIDGDGWLDVFVGRSPVADTDPETSGGPHPRAYPFAMKPPNIFLSNRDGTWRDVTAVVVPGGIEPGNTFVGGLIDLDADADIDLFLVQDAQNRVTNRLYENIGRQAASDEYFRDVTDGCGCTRPLAGMGLAVVDLDHNGLPDLFVTNLVTAEPNREALLMNYGGLQFQDFAEPLGAVSMDAFAEKDARSASWAAMALDVQNDGREDLYVVYSPLTYSMNDERRVRNYNPEVIADQPNALLVAEPDGRYTVAVDSGLEDRGLSHAAVTADFNGDGCEDVFVVNIDTPSRLYRNPCASGAHFVELQLVGSTANRDAIGARVHVEAGGRVFTRQVLGCSTGSSSCMPKRVHIGLDGATRLDAVRIDWPGGGHSMHPETQVDAVNVLVQPPPNRATAP